MSSQEPGGQDPAARRAQGLSEYLKSPISTLLESLEDELQERVSTLDVIQAYGLCSARVKNLSSAVGDKQERTEAFNYLRENASSVLQCLARDIKGAMTEFYGEATNITMSPRALTGARASATLAQHALAFVAQMACLAELSEIWKGTTHHNFCSATADKPS